ncbi:MAG TPA: hypothetical protein VET48_11260 [Steroidobacteraceae bacterium]|nr:hypothetical protein [Steroidobacteraceae bacterium]
MKYRLFGSRIFVAVSAVTLCLLGASTFAQSAKLGTWKAPRNEYGYPDLQGNWTNATITPIERPVEFGERRALTDAEANKLEGAAVARVEEGNKPTDPKKGIQDLPVNCAPGFSGTNCGYNNFWVDGGSMVVRVNGEKRSSIIVDPANGRRPAMNADAQKRMQARMAAFRGGGGGGMADGPEMRPLGERCILSFGSSAGPPMLPSMYNNNYQIVQSKDRVVILVEMVHDARVVRIGGEHLPSNIRPWMGDSIGHYEGDTLVVETTNFRPQQNMTASENLKVTERFTRVAPNQIVYRFTIDDPLTYVQPYTGELNMNATRDNLYEYACHEGNYALPGILAGAREEELQAAKKAAK